MSYDQKLANAEKRIAELEVQLQAWHRFFGTTQLTHAAAKMEKLESTVSALVEALEKISSDKEFSHGLKNGESVFVRKVWYVEFSKEVLAAARKVLG